MARDRYVLVTSSGEISFDTKLPDAVAADKLVVVAPEDAIAEIQKRQARGQTPHAVISCPIVGQPLMDTLDGMGITPEYVIAPSMPPEEYKYLADRFAARAIESIPPACSADMVRYAAKALGKCGYELSEDERQLNGRGRSHD